MSLLNVWTFDFSDGGPTRFVPADEALAEVERLREALERIADAGEFGMSDGDLMRNVARKALGLPMPEDDEPLHNLTQQPTREALRPTREALRELYAGMMGDTMPGQALLDWHARHPWADEVVDDR